MSTPNGSSASPGIPASPANSNHGNESKWKNWGMAAFEKVTVVSDWAAGYANAGSQKLCGERFFPKSNDFLEEVAKCERILRAFTVEGIEVKVKSDEPQEPANGSVKKFVQQKGKVLRKIPPQAIRSAKGIIIYTSMRSGIAPLGGSGGVGLMMARLSDGSWSAPSSITPNNLAVGLLLGFDIFDAILLVNTDLAMEKFKSHKVTLGAETAVAAGPFGTGISGEMGLDRSPVFSYVRSRGMYAGAEAIAQVFLHRFDENERVYYWPGITAKDIFDGKVRIPEAVEPLHRALEDAETGIAQGDSLERIVFDNLLVPPNVAVKKLESQGADDILQDGERLKLPPTPEELDAMESVGILDEFDLEMERKATQDLQEIERREREEIRRLPPPPKHPHVVKYWKLRGSRPGDGRQMAPPLSPNLTNEAYIVAVSSPLKNEVHTEHPESVTVAQQPIEGEKSFEIATDEASGEHPTSNSITPIDTIVETISQSDSTAPLQPMDEVSLDNDTHKDDQQEVVSKSSPSANQNEDTAVLQDAELLTIDENVPLAVQHQIPLSEKEKVEQNDNIEPFVENVLSTDSHLETEEPNGEKDKEDEENSTKVTDQEEAGTGVNEQAIAETNIIAPVPIAAGLIASVAAMTETISTDASPIENATEMPTEPIQLVKDDSQAALDLESRRNSIQGTVSSSSSEMFEDAMTSSGSVAIPSIVAEAEVIDGVQEEAEMVIFTPTIIETPVMESSTPTFRTFSPRPESVRSMDSNGTHESTIDGHTTGKPQRPVRPPRVRPVSSVNPASSPSSLKSPVALSPVSLSPILLEVGGADIAIRSESVQQNSYAADARMMLFLDWDETITAKDTLALISPPAKTQLHGPDFSHYVEKYLEDLEAFTNEFGQRDTLEQQLRFLEEIDQIEAQSVHRVEEGQLFKGAKRSELVQRAEEVEFRDGWSAADEWLIEMKEQGKVETDIISVGWSADFIRHALAHRRAGPTSAVHVPRIICTNEVEMMTGEDGQQSGTGKLVKSSGASPDQMNSGICTGIHKLAELKYLIGQRKKTMDGSNQQLPVSVYVGDSNTDLPCLLEADVSILIGGNESLKATLKRIGLESNLVKVEDWLQTEQAEELTTEDVASGLTTQNKKGKTVRRKPSPSLTVQGETEEKGQETQVSKTLIAAKDWNEVLRVLKKILDKDEIA